MTMNIFDDRRLAGLETDELIDIIAMIEAELEKRNTDLERNYRDRMRALVGDADGNEDMDLNARVSSIFDPDEEEAHPDLPPKDLGAWVHIWRKLDPITDKEKEGS